MNVRNFAVLGAIVTTLGLPAVAQATDPVSCASPIQRNVSEGGSAVRVGVCVQGSGYIEAGIGTEANLGQIYVVASSDSNGYVGVSSFESGGDTQPCEPSGPDGGEGGSGTNSGGCYGTNAILVDLTLLSGIVPMPVCGDDTGAWYSTSRNGCRADNEDVNQGVAAALATVACIQGGGRPDVCILANFP